MARLPTRLDLGGLPSVKTGRAIPNVRIATPDISVASNAAVRAAEQKGRATVDAMDQLGRSQIRMAETLGQGAVELARAQGIGGEAIARGIKTFGEGINSISEAIAKRQEEEDTLALLRADADLELAMARHARDIVDNDPNHKGWGERFDLEITPEIEAAVAAIPNARDREKFLIAANLKKGLKTEELLGESTKRNRVANVAHGEETIQKLEQQWVDASTDAERSRIEAQITRALDEMVSLNLIDEGERLKRLTKSKELVDKLALAHAEADPTGYQKERAKRRGGAADITSEAEGTTDRAAWRNGFASGYDVPLDYGKWGRPPKPLTEMTLEEVYEFGKSMRKVQYNNGKGEVPWIKGRKVKWDETSSAVGRYQITGRTMKDYMAKAGLTWEDKFTPENQDKLFFAILEGQGFGAWEGYKKHPELLAKAKIALNAPSGRYANGTPEGLLKADAKAQEQLTKVGSIWEANKRFEHGPDVWPMNPLDPDEKKRMDAVAEDEGWSQAIMKQDWELYDNRIVPWIAKWGAIPDGVKGAIESGLRSSDPKKVAAALQAMDGIQMANPRALLNTMADSDVELMERYRIEREFATSDEEIGQKIVDERLDDSKKQANEVKRREGEEIAKKRAPYVSGLFYDGWFQIGDRPQVNRIIGGITRALPDMPEGTDFAALQQDYIRVYALAYEKTNDVSKADAMARSLTLKRWSESNVSGVRRIMRNAPERFNPQGLEAKWQRIQARLRVPRHLIGENPFILESDDRTDLEVAQGKTPTWIVMVPATTNAGMGE